MPDTSKPKFIDVDLAVCDHILRDQEALTAFEDSPITNAMLVGDGQKVHTYIKDYYLKYSKVPDKTTIEANLGITWDSVAPEPLEFYLDTIHKRSTLMTVSEGVKKIHDAVKTRDPEKAVEKLKEVVTDVDALYSAPRRRDVNYKDSVDERRKRYEEVSKFGKGIVGIAFPWATLNEFTGGLEPGDLATFVASTGRGKSWCLVAMAAYALMAGKRCMFVSKEMPPPIIALRVDSVLASLSFDSIRRGRLSDIGEKGRYKEFLDKVEKEEIYKNLEILSSVSANTVADLDFRVAEFKPDIVYLDGVYIMKGANQKWERHAQREQVIEDLKFLAEKQRVPIIATAQFQRAMGKGKAEEKMKGGLSDIGATFAISQWSDTVIGIFQNEELKKNHRMILRLLKNRHGDQGEDIPLLTNFQTMEFKELQVNRGIAIQAPTRPSGKDKYSFF